MGDTNRERVEEYNYLGILLTWNGKAKTKSAVKATRAMYSVIQNGRRLNLPILHRAENWGFDNMDVIENIHTRFCKIITKKSKYCHNSFIYGEFGRFPLQITATIR